MQSSIFYNCWSGLQWLTLCFSLTTTGRKNMDRQCLESSRQSRNLRFLFCTMYLPGPVYQCYQAGKRRVKVHRWGCGHLVVVVRLHKSQQEYKWLHRSDTCHFSAVNNKTTSYFQFTASVIISHYNTFEILFLCSHSVRTDTHTQSDPPASRENRTHTSPRKHYSPTRRWHRRTGGI